MTFLELHPMKLSRCFKKIKISRAIYKDKQGIAGFGVKLRVGYSCFNQRIDRSSQARWSQRCQEFSLRLVAADIDGDDLEFLVLFRYVYGFRAALEAITRFPFIPSFGEFSTNSRVLSERNVHPLLP